MTPYSLFDRLRPCQSTFRRIHGESDTRTSTASPPAFQEAGGRQDGLRLLNSLIKQWVHKVRIDCLLKVIIESGLRLRSWGNSASGSTSANDLKRRLKGTGRKSTKSILITFNILLNWIWAQKTEKVLLRLILLVSIFQKLSMKSLLNHL